MAYDFFPKTTEELQKKITYHPSNVQGELFLLFEHLKGNFPALETPINLDMAKKQSVNVSRALEGDVNLAMIKQQMSLKNTHQMSVKNRHQMSVKNTHQRSVKNRDEKSVKKKHVEERSRDVEVTTEIANNYEVTTEDMTTLENEAENEEQNEEDREPRPAGLEVGTELGAASEVAPRSSTY